MKRTDKMKRKEWLFVIFITLSVLQYVTSKVLPGNFFVNFDFYYYTSLLLLFLFHFSLIFLG